MHSDLRWTNSRRENYFTILREQSALLKGYHTLSSLLYIYMRYYLIQRFAGMGPGRRFRFFIL
jgi:hypothetical protein